MPDSQEKSKIKKGMGWLKDTPSPKDFTVDHDLIPRKLGRFGEKTTIKNLLKRLCLHEPAKAKIPSSMNLKEWCPPINTQGNINACTANAASVLLEYYERRAFGQFTNPSRLFIYKASRNLLQLTGDTGANPRSAMGSLELFGAPPEKYWPYDIEKYDDEPPAFCYAFAQNYHGLLYFRLDDGKTATDQLLQRIKVHLAGGLPAMFGFPVYSSIHQADTSGQIPYPCKGEQVIGGHAVMAMGFDDNMIIKNADCTLPIKGAIMIQNSWGETWGEGGFGWIPYEYIIQSLAVDWWSILKSEWVNTQKFGI